MVEDMEVESTPSPVAETRHRNQRERDITIRFQDAPNGHRHKSIFAENDKARPPYQRQETCRVFVQGEGEVTHFETPPYYLQMEQSGGVNQNGSGDANGNRRSSSKDSLLLDASGERHHHQHSVFDPKGKGERLGPTEALMEDDGPSLRPLHCELSLVESSEDEDGGEDEEESCLKEILPAGHAEELRHTRVAERLADIFIRCLGIRGCLRLGPTAFRMFARWVGRVTWVMSRGSCHMGHVTWVVSRGSCHVGRVTWVMSCGSCHVGRVSGPDVKLPFFVVVFSKSRL